MKQAVVLIHGIGEQKPMATLRKFVSAILPPAAKGQEQYWSKPDPMSDLLELRRLQTPGRTKTHFYEYYWAYQVDGTKMWHLVQWFVDLLFRRWRDVPAALRGVWVLSWVLTSALMGLAALGGLAYYQSWYAAQPKYGAIWLSVMLVTGSIQSFLIHYVGDAARYLSPHPRNIAVRQKIRAEGLQLLRALHDSRDYDRIIVVGHSLGSVIGYDLITHLWTSYNGVYDFVKHGAALAELLDKRRAPQPVIRHGLHDAAKVLFSSADTPGALDGYRDAQFEGWKEQRRWGNPWRISDFVTLGSPLAHSMLLLARDRDEFEERKRQRELPTCPPVSDEKGFAYSNPEICMVGEGKKFSPLTLHHAAPFAVTRWTNLFFPAYRGLFGDVIGGPLRQVFGLGIKDIPVRIRSWVGFTPAAHTAYWKPENIAADSSQQAGKYRFALEELKHILELDGIRKFRIGAQPLTDAGSADVEN